MSNSIQYKTTSICFSFINDGRILFDHSGVNLEHTPLINIEEC